ncbi:hypothetical protein [Herbiconiux flava]|uniref:Uncharacterized protein n=1 Tax=Herbiconiux flava TaxID=881268 RepID=A0A852SP47_9MICO|nr:hypothetical protein [Herbiconiux flava]NYD70574.1 hypothetical protein [Herbiconiux flava]GLK17331.1 hypothetical protein GCM10017602_18130 [Herbiconiux flava]
MVSYLQNLLLEVDAIEEQYVAIAGSTPIGDVNLNEGGYGTVLIVGTPVWGRAPSTAPEEVARSQCLSAFSDWFIRYRLLFPDRLPRVMTTLRESTKPLATALGVSSVRRALDTPGEVEAAQ